MVTDDTPESRKPIGRPPGSPGRRGRQLSTVLRGRGHSGLYSPAKLESTAAFIGMSGMSPSPPPKQPAVTPLVQHHMMAEEEEEEEGSESGVRVRS